MPLRCLMVCTGQVRWLFSLPMLLIAVGVVLYALRLAAGNVAELTAAIAGLDVLGQPRYWLMWLLTIVCVKVMHELAHALTCKLVGGRCHEMGVILLAFVPCLYCDVTDVWRMPSKWQRIAVSAAGMLVELLIASLALIVWSYTQPGLLNLWCLSVVIVCTVGTVLINANPLLRYDGYYILADLLEVPNLSSRAQGLMSEKLKGWLMNQPPREDPLLGRTRRKAVMLYAICAKVYLTVLIVFIFAGLLALARPYRLENLVYSMGVVTLVGMLAAPVLGIAKLWRNPSSRYRVRIPRALALVAILGMAAAALFYVPIERTISGAAVFVPVESRTVYATTGGFLRTAKAAGEQVSAGDAIATLENDGLTLSVTKQAGEYQVRKASFEQLKTLRSWDATAAERTPTAQAAMTEAEKLLIELHKQQNELQLTAPMDGTIIAPPALEQDAPEGSLSTWSGSPLDPKNLGCWIEPGTVLCMVGDPKSLKALVTVDETDAPEIERGQRVRILVASAPVRIVEGEVTDVARRGNLRSAEDSIDRRARQHLVEFS